jgi:hypothetical protein
MASKLRIDVTSLADLDLDRNTTYTLQMQAGYVVETDQLAQPNITFNFAFTTDNGPALVSTSPSNGATNIGNISSVTLTFDRTVRRGNGNVYFYNNNLLGDTLIKTINVTETDTNSTSDVKFINATTVQITIADLLNANDSFYFLMDDGVIQDSFGIDYVGINDENTVRFTTQLNEDPFSIFERSANLNVASSLSATYRRVLATATASLVGRFTSSAQSFIKLPIRASASMSSSSSLSLTPLEITPDTYYLTNSSNFSYTEDTTSFLVNNSKITNTVYVNSNTNEVNQSYTFTITPSNTSAVSNFAVASNILTAQNVTLNFNNTTKVLTLQGPRNGINTVLDNVSFTPTTDFDQNFTLSYSVITPGDPINPPVSASKTKIQNVILGAVVDSEVTGFVNGTFQSSIASRLFNTVPVQVTDFDTSGPSYTATITVSQGEIGKYVNPLVAVPGARELDWFGFDGATGWSSSLTNTVTLGPNSRTGINLELANVWFYPNTTSNTTVTLTLQKNGNTLYSGSITLSHSGKGIMNFGNYYGVGAGFTGDLNTSPFPFEGYISYGTWKYGFLRVYLVGGGGGSSNDFPNPNRTISGAGGGGGQVRNQNFGKLSNSPFDNEVKTFTGRAGAGGRAGFTFPAAADGIRYQPQNGGDSFINIFGGPWTSAGGKAAIAGNSTTVAGTGGTSGLPGFTGAPGYVVSSGDYYGGAGGGSGGSAVAKTATTNGVRGAGVTLPWLAGNKIYSKGGGVSGDSGYDVNDNDAGYGGNGTRGYSAAAQRRPLCGMGGEVVIIITN